MEFNEHLDLKGKHAILSPSKYSWMNYSDEKFAEVLTRRQAQKRGNDFHDLAQRCILLGVKMPNIKAAFNMYVNDAIGFNMKPEQILMYSANAFGCADAISYRSKKLRIHDLKTGITPANMNQLLAYSALFYLEYKVRPDKISTELRIYQGQDIVVYVPEAEEIVSIMNKVVAFDKMIEDISFS